MGRRDESALVLGGSGLVGYQVARKLVAQAGVRRVVLAALLPGETREAVRELREEFPEIEVRGYAGNLFLPGEPVAVDDGADGPGLPPRSAEMRRRIFEDLYNDFESAYRDSLLARLLLRERPDIVVDAVNTATGISYQDVFTASQTVRAALDDGDPEHSSLREDVENLLVSLSIPQLILHIRILNRALTEAEARMYLKVGTTGTGGMGLNIPYTHGEERPSPQLLNKTAIAFAQTGMLFLMARTPGTPIIKEVKPAALIGYRGVEFREARGKQYHRHERNGGVEYELGSPNEPYTLYRARRLPLGKTLDLTPDPTPYEVLPGPDGSGHLKVPLVDTGENGLFTLGEFEAITALDQMEYITPEEIADIVVMEVVGGGTGKDVISAVDSSVLGSTYKAGLLRPVALEVLAKMEETHGVPSIALGRLGPPDLAKHLFEAYLFRRRFGNLETLFRFAADAETPGEALSRELFAQIEGDDLLASLIVSIGIPVFCPEGESLLRGPVIKAPPYRKFRSEVDLDPESLERYALTWVDLRPARMDWWLRTFETMSASRPLRQGSGWATARVNRETYLAEDIEIGNVVAWIFSNQSSGFRVL